MRHERSLYAASNARKLPFEGAQQRASTFLLKHSFYGFQGAKLCWLAGEMTKYREGTRGGGGKGYKYSSVGSAAYKSSDHVRQRPQRRSLMFPFICEEKKYLSLCTQPETINGQEP